MNKLKLFAWERSDEYRRNNMPGVWFWEYAPDCETRCEYISPENQELYRKVTSSNA